jgi:hypothetical protein
MKKEGFFQLQNAHALFEKMKHDLARIEKNPNDPYPLFDFFVTARCIPEWIYPNNKTASKDLFENHVELRICRHIADGAKHFEATHSQNKQIKGTSVSYGGFQSNAFQRNAFQIGGGLYVVLEPAEARILGYEATIKAVNLAKVIFNKIDEILKLTSPPAS